MRIWAAPPAGHWVAVRKVAATDAVAFARQVLLAPDRKVPVVGVTTGPAGRAWVDPERLAAALTDRAQVVLLETGEATWALSSALPRRLDVYGGAVRVWWPGLGPQSNPDDHPLLFLRGSERAEATFIRIVEGVTADSATLRRPPPSVWDRIAQEYAVGDVVRSRVARIADRYVLVELLPDACAIVPIREIDYTYLEHPSEIVQGGQAVAVKILSLDVPANKCTASIKQAYGAPPRPAIALVPGGEPFLADTTDGDTVPSPTVAADESEALGALREELDSAVEDRDVLMKQLRAANNQLAGLRKALRSAEDRLQALEQRASGDLDPMSSEVAFLAAVRVEYARRFDEADRLSYPLQRMRVGREFLDTVRRLERVGVAKIVEVCAQVASGRARELAGRSVHEFRSGAPGSPGVARAADGAKAFRCSLQEGTPSARRLHWWMIPGGDGPTIEFASVAVHDDLSLPGQSG